MQKKKKENNTDLLIVQMCYSSRRYIIIKSDICDNFEAKPFRANYFIAMIFAYVIENLNGIVQSGESMENTHGLKAFLPRGPQAFQLLLTINVQ